MPYTILIVYYFLKLRLGKECRDFLTVILYNHNATKIIEREQLSQSNDDDAKFFIRRLLS